MRKTIVELKGYCLKPFCLIMEFLPYGSLYDYLKKHKGILDISLEIGIHSRQYKDIPWAMKLKIAQNIADALHFLHSQKPKILHRDLKSPNVLVITNIFTINSGLTFVLDVRYEANN